MAVLISLAALGAAVATIAFAVKKTEKKNAGFPASRRGRR